MPGRDYLRMPFAEIAFVGATNQQCRGWSIEFWNFYWGRIVLGGQTTDVSVFQREMQLLKTIECELRITENEVRSLQCSFTPRREGVPNLDPVDPDSIRSSETWQSGMRAGRADGIVKEPVMGECGRMAASRKGELVSSRTFDFELLKYSVAVLEADDVRPV